MRRFLTRAVLVFAFLITVLCSGLDRPLRILVTNDDGYRSRGLAALVEELAKVGTVIVSAPLGERSGSSQSIDFRSPLLVERVYVKGAMEAFAIDAPPARAADFGLAVLGKEDPFDLVVSGINIGANLGDLTHISGTIGAAMQGVLRHVPAIAVSQDSRSQNFSLAARYISQLVQDLNRRGFPEGVVLSVNVPVLDSLEGCEAVATSMGGRHVKGATYEKVVDDELISQWEVRRSSDAVVDSERIGDTAAFLDGKITVTPLRFDWSDPDLVDRLNRWLPQPASERK